MALEALLAKLDADARDERAALLAEAEAQAKKLREETDAELSRKRRRALEAVRSEASATVRARTAKVRAEARRMVFEARQHVLDRVRRATEGHIADGAREREYREALPADVAAALARAPDGPVRLRAPPVLADAIQDVLSGAEAEDARQTGHEDRGAGEGRRSIEMATDESIGTGFVLVGDEGRVMIDATLGARLDRVWPSEAQRVLRELGG